MAKKNYVPIAFKDRVVYLLSGCLLLAIGSGAAWLCHTWAGQVPADKYHGLWIAGSGGLAFFMLRGAWFGFFPPRKEIKMDLLGNPDNIAA